MHILLVSIAYPPEIRSASQLTFEFASELIKLGHQVTVLTSYPRYNLSKESREIDYETSSIEEGVSVIRIKSLPVHKVPLIVRGIGELTLPFVFALYAKQYVKKPVDIIEVYSPPLTLGLAGSILKKYFKAPLIVNVQDLFPQNAVDIGLIKNRTIVGFFRLIEKIVYRISDLVTVHSKGNRRFLITARKQPESKVRVIPNWIDATPFISAKKTGKFQKRFGLEGKFVLLFAGVLGPAQGLDVIIDAAMKLNNIKEVLFLFVGDGTEKKQLQRKSESLGLTNVQFEPFVSLDEYPSLVKDCDVGLLSITPLYRTPVVPGKLLGYMAGGLPVISSLNKESDGHDILRESGAGIPVISGDIPGLVEAVLRLNNDRDICARMGGKGLEYVQRHFSRRHCVSLYTNLFKHLLRRRESEQYG